MQAGDKFTRLHWPNVATDIYASVQGNTVFATGQAGADNYQLGMTYVSGMVYVTTLRNGASVGNLQIRNGANVLPAGGPYHLDMPAIMTANTPFPAIYGLLVEA
jgi:hypothetical protein